MSRSWAARPRRVRPRSPRARPRRRRGPRRAAAPRPAARPAIAGVEGRVVAGLGGHGPRAGAVPEPAPRLLRLRAPPGASGRTPSRSAASWTSSPCFPTRAAGTHGAKARAGRRPEHARRQVAALAAGVRERDEARRRPPARRDGGASSSAVDRTGRPKSTIAWSMRWLPRSASSPPASSGSGRSRQARAASPPGASARSATPAASTVPSAPSAISRRSVRKSPSQRRFWNTVRSHPGAPASATNARPSAAVGASGLSTTTAKARGDRDARASGTWARLGAATTTRSTVAR